MSQSSTPGPYWSAYMAEIYRSRRPPTLGTVNIAKVEKSAREKLKDDEHAFMYVFGSAGSSETYAANIAEMRAWKIIPRMLRDATNRHVRTTIFGVEHPSPLFLAPIGVQGLMHPDGECASAAAAAELGIPYILSTAATRSIEKIAEVSGSAHRWYQIYWPGTNDVTVSLLKRAKANGYSALVVTLDTPMIGWRPHDLDDAYLPFIHGVGCQIGLTDPVFMGLHGEKPDSRDDYPKHPYDWKAFDAAAMSGDAKTLRRVELSVAWLAETSRGLYRNWDDLEFLRKHWDGPIVLKGIQSIQDARTAVDRGINGIIVSNHGGRQVDGAIPSLYALNKICSDEKVKAAQSSGKLTVLFDSGIRSGSDIIKAVALGANAVLLGRPFMYGLCLGGQDGVEMVIKTILADLEITIGLAGYKDLDEIRGKGEEVVTRLEQTKL